MEQELQEIVKKIMALMKEPENLQTQQEIDALLEKYPDLKNDFQDPAQGSRIQQTSSMEQASPSFENVKKLMELMEKPKTAQTQQEIEALIQMYPCLKETFSELTELDAPASPQEKEALAQSKQPRPLPAHVVEARNRAEEEARIRSAQLREHWQQNIQSGV